MRGFPVRLVLERSKDPLATRAELALGEAARFLRSAGQLDGAGQPGPSAHRLQSPAGLAQTECGGVMMHTVKISLIYRHQSAAAGQPTRKNIAMKSVTKTDRKHYLKWTLWAAMGMVILLCVAAWFKLASLWLGGFQPPEMAAAQYSNKDVIGNLGGLPVRLPRYAVHLVEYDGEPSWGKSKNPTPRTEATGIKSFGFYARYPDMQMIDSYATEKEQKSQSIYTSMWLDVGVTSGEIYPKDGFLDRVFACLIRSTAPPRCGGEKVYWWDDYERLPKSEHGLTVYALKGIEPKSGQPAREDKTFAKDVFVAKDKQGRVRTYIDCSNVGHEAAPCGHTFSMEYDGMHADISVKYRRGLLPHWQDIQAKVTQALLGFVVQAPSASDTHKAPTATPLR